MCSWPSGVSNWTTLPLAVTQYLRKLSPAPEVKVKAQVAVAASLIGPMLLVWPSAACCGEAAEESEWPATPNEPSATRASTHTNVFIRISVQLLEEGLRVAARASPWRCGQARDPAFL